MVGVLVTKFGADMLTRLQTDLSLEDAYNLLEIVQVNAYNEYISNEYWSQKAKEKKR